MPLHHGRVLAARFPQLAVRYIYATRGADIHPNVQRKADQLQNLIRSLFSDADAKFEFLRASDLLAQARRAPLTSYKLSLAETPICSSGEVGFICLVRLGDYNSFITDEAGQLRRQIFEANVRDYQRSSQVNEEIQQSLRARTREDFWWLNNGITIVAQQAVQSGKTLTLQDPQVVNGLQTSTEIYNYFQASNTGGDERNILLRVIVPGHADSRDRIIKATNSQTALPPASLRATDKIHRDIEEFLRPFGLFYERRKSFYKNEGKPIQQIVGIPYVAQAVMAILLQRPDSARARPSSLLKKDEDYKLLFDPDYPIALYRSCAEIARRIETLLRADSTFSPKDRNNLRFYVMMHLAASATAKRQPLAADLANLNVKEISDSTIAKSIAIIKNQ